MVNAKKHKKISTNWKRLTKQIPDLEEHIQQGKINVVPLPRGKKKPYITDWNNRVYSLTEGFTYTNKGGKQTQRGLKYHTGNYGILIGYGNKENGYSIGCIDIDGYKTSEDNPDLEIKKETQKLIYEDFKDLPNCIIVQTQSGGYHIYYWTKKTQPDTSITSNSLYYPKDFPIKNLAGKCLNDSIEVFTNQDMKQCVLPGSQTKLPENNYKVRNYKVISTVNRLSEMDTVDDLNQLVIDTLVSKGYGYKPVQQDEPKKVTKKQIGKRSKNDSTLKSLSQDEINQVVQLVTPIFPVIDGKKHTGAMYLGGYFSYHITKDSSSQIAKGIVKEIGTIFNNSQDFINTVLENYTRQVNKAGLPKLCKLIQQRDNTFNIGIFTSKLNSICNPDYKKRITRPIISKPYDINQYLENGTGYNNKLYLAYIYQNKKYILITQKERDFYFKPLDTSYDPVTLFNRTGNANWEEMETEIKAILGNTKSKGLDKVVSKIITELLKNLNDLFINNHFTTLKTFPKSLKQFILNPVDTYNMYNTEYEYDREIIKGVKNDINNKIEEIIELYNENSLYITDDWLNKQVKHLVSYTSRDPFLSLHLGHKPVKYYQATAGEFIVKEFGLKRHLKDNKETLYFYNDNLKYYDEITTANLKRKLYETLGFNLVESDINAITNAVSNEDILYRNLLVFRNMYYNTDTLDEFKPLLEVNTYNRQDYLTVNNIGTYNETNNTITLLDYQKELKLEDILTVKGIETTDDDGNPTIQLPEITQEELNTLPVEEYKTKYGMSLTEIVLRQILIPKDDPTDIRLFKDKLERLGSNIYGSNLYKVITFYYNDGDGGKSILNLFNNLIFNKLDYEIKPETLKDSFNLENFFNRLLITIDEVTRDSFTDLKDYLKQMSSKYSKVEGRQLYTANTFTLYGFPNIEIFSNELLDLQPIEDGALFSRIDYLELPNKFVEKSELDKYNNTYLKLEGLEDKLKQDTDGLSWLITAGILCFKNMKQTTNRYTKRQTREETIEVFLGADSLTKYLLVYTEFVEDLPEENFTSNVEITNGYLEYMAGLNREVDQDGLPKKIGLKLNKLYPQLKQEGNKVKDYENNGGKKYKLKLKSSEDITKEYNEGYAINEYATDRQLSILDTNDKLKTVYDQIQKGNCTISILTSKLPGLDCLDLVQQLDSLDLIYNTGQPILNKHIKEDSQ